MLSVVILDFDGVIADTEQIHLTAVRRILNDFDIEVPTQLWSTELIGLRTYDIFRKLIVGRHAELDLQELVAKKRRTYAQILSEVEIRCRPGIEELMIEATGLGKTVAVASSSSLVEVEDTLVKLGIKELITTIVTVDEAGHPKPHPAVYWSIIDHLGGIVEEMLAIEDSPVGVASAKNAGLFCVAYPNQFTIQLDLSQADVVIEKLDKSTINLLLSGRFQINRTKHNFPDDET
jgi:HAD superfamily hydrolase (TIGR01509 family)